MNSSEHPTHRLNPPQPLVFLAGKRPASASRRRAGYIMAEAIMAFAIFGIALAGLFPFVLTQLKLTRKLEARFQGDVISYKDVARQYPVYPNHQNQAQTYYDVPWKNPRMQSLIGGALITTNQGNAIDDYTSQSLNNLTSYPATIYNYQITYPDMTSDPTITVNLNVEVP